ncbi:hypothetical protein [uncultured Salipiger sp.]|uniref:hypothetical protein n=1 Tax=uncultured Salipiger sp. TaxID=499810 RepID=UPI002592174F|nr:hypothetical protein [uncultured Salipiger sp.]
MSFVLKEVESAPLLAPLQGQTPDFAETFKAGVVAERVETDSWQRAQRTTRDVLAEQKAGLSSANAYGDGPEATRSRSTQRQFDAELDYVLARNVELVRQNPELRTFGVPTTRDEFAGIVTDRLKAEHADAMDVLDLGGGGAGFLGRMWAGVTDETTVLTLPFGAPAGSRLLLAAGIEAAVNVGAEALTLERQRDVAERLDLPEPNAASQLGIAALTGGILGGGIAGALRYGEHIRAKRQAQAAQRPDGAEPLSFGDEVNRAERELRGDQYRPGTPSASTVSAELPSDAPANWPQIKNGIFAGESGGDYNALFSFQNRPGGRFENVRLTEMTVDEAIAFSQPGGEYAGWVKSRIGRVATPMGAYQVVGTTLRAAKRALGLRGDELMSEAMQDRIGIWIYRNQGTGAWVGYRGPRSTPPGAVDPNTRAPAFSGYTTRRGYTASGQVTAGDGFRVDVDYQVVDLASLQRAGGDLQPRDRSRAASDEQIASIAAGLDPARLMPSPEADRGAPIVGPDNVVESGNGRVAAIGRVYDLHPDRADAYRQQIVEAGFEIPGGVERPVLIARRTTELDDAGRQGLVRAANTSQIARMSATERARMEARGLDVATLSRFRPGRLDAPDNAEFVRGFLDTLPQAERAGLVDARKMVNAEGLRRLGEALFARAWEASDIVARFAETDAGDLKSLLDALRDAAPEWAALRAAVADGRIRPEMDITDYVLDAMRTIALARDIATREGGTVSAALEDLLAQADLLAGDVAPLTEALIRKFAPNGRAARADTIAEFLKRYAAEAQKIGGSDTGLFDTPGPLDALKAIDRESFGRLKELGRAAVPPAPEPDAQLEAMPAGIFDEGAASPSIEAADNAILEDLREILRTRRVTDEEHDAVEEMIETQIRARSPLSAEDQRRIDSSYATNGDVDVAQLIRNGLSPIPQDMTLYRGFSTSEMADDGLMSFSPSRATAEGFGRVEEVTLPAGTMVYSPRSGISGGEILVPRETYELLTSSTREITAADVLDVRTRAELEAFASETFELEDGTPMTIREYLDDLDADEALATVVDLCGLKGGA